MRYAHDNVFVHVQVKMRVNDKVNIEVQLKLSKKSIDSNWTSQGMSLAFWTTVVPL